MQSHSVHRGLCSCQNRMSKWFKSSFCSGLTDLAPTPQDSTPHPSSHHTLGALDTPFFKLYMCPTVPLLCVCVSILHAAFVKLLTTSVSVAQKTTSLCSVIRLLGFPALWLHSTSQRFGKERKNNDSSGLSRLIVQSFFFPLLAKRRWTQTHPQPASSLIYLHFASLLCVLLKTGQVVQRSPLSVY